jgi:glyoxylase-like metal-dependent hydrolase (beta-lactamase superfamily II)
MIRSMNVQIHTLDLNFQNVPQAIASYLLETGEGPILVETGPGSTQDTLVKRLAQHGYRPADVRHVFVSHIHLDHAGGAGWWAHQGAQIYVHRVGAPHLIDPSRLLTSARRIYGDMMDTLWGDIVPAPATRVTALGDGDTVRLGDLTFSALDTPGHAYHHHVICLGSVAFTGDAAGVHMPGGRFAALPAPPPEFDLEAWLQTVDRLLAHHFTAIYPTHFGLISEVSDHLEYFRSLLLQAANFVRERMVEGMGRDELVTAYLAWNEERALSAGVSEQVAQRYEVANPNAMSVDGMMRYWRKKGVG